MPADGALTLDQVLAITYTSGHAWAPDGRSIGYIHDDGGRYSLRLADADGGKVREISRGDEPVSEFAWGSDGDLAYVQSGRLYLMPPAHAGGGRADATLLYAPAAPVSGIAWAPSGRSLACVSDGRAWIIALDPLSVRDLRVPGFVRPLYHEPPIAWSPDGRGLALTMVAGQRWGLSVMAQDGSVAWTSTSDEIEGPLAWLHPDRLLYAESSGGHTVRTWRRLDVSRGSVRAAWREEEPEGLGQAFRPRALADERSAVMVLRHEGWWHVYVLDTDNGTVRALSGGACEDVGHAVDLPQISPDGREIVFASSRVNLGQRHLYAVDIESGTTRPLTAGPGTSVEPQWSPDGRRVAFKHSTIQHAPEIWLVSRDGGGMRRLVGSMPDGLAPERFPLPELVHTRGANDWEIPGYLLTPQPRVPGRRYPALVYVHGGGMRQMREGFPPLEAYAFFYAVSLWLAGRGVVSYLVNYRGGIGYGRSFEQGNSRGLGVLECEDCVRAGEYVKTLPFVDPARVGIWGLSYGGWLTLASLVRSPATFALGINIAGIWDFDRWMAWAKTNYRPPYDYFLGRAGGTREERPDVWDEASPGRLAARMRSPLVNLHGTADEAVPFEQLDLIVRDCVRHGKRFETHYYPGETHLFTRRDTWRDALTKVEEALRRYLGLD
jgi:dipeptidyl aminopeptidase/acylaminoacyl peptidase